MVGRATVHGEILGEKQNFVCGVACSDFLGIGFMEWQVNNQCPGTSCTLSYASIAHKLESFSPLGTLNLEHLLPDSEQAFLYILLPNATFLNINQADILLLRLEKVKHRQTRANVIV
jgi:hypothetical protein